MTSIRDRRCYNNCRERRIHGAVVPRDCGRKASRKYGVYSSRNYATTIKTTLSEPTTTYDIPVNASRSEQTQNGTRSGEEQDHFPLSFTCIRTSSCVSKLQHTWPATHKDPSYHPCHPSAPAPSSSSSRQQVAYWQPPEQQQQQPHSPASSSSYPQPPLAFQRHCHLVTPRS
jgi:hypothetical protein